MVVSTDNFIDVGEPDDDQQGNQHDNATPAQRRLTVASEDGQLLDTDAAVGASAPAATATPLNPTLTCPIPLPSAMASCWRLMVKASWKWSSVKA